MSRQRFRRHQRLRTRRDFDRVFARRAVASDAVLVVMGCENDRDCSRLGLVVSRRVGTAVQRNRWKRLIREAFRLQQQGLPSGVDLVIQPRKGAQPEFARLVRSLPRLAWQVVERLGKTRGRS